MRHALSLALLAAAAPAIAAEIVAVPEFESVRLRGGGELVVRHGPVQRVRLLEGNSRVSRLAVDRETGRTGRGGGETLVISACEIRCPRDYKLKVEVTTPKLAGLSIEGGGAIRVGEDFPQQQALGLAIAGGGTIHAQGVRAGSVGASIKGGGLINTHAVDSLGASINGGGAIRYWGNPTRAVNINGGGAVTRGGAR